MREGGSWFSFLSSLELGAMALLDLPYLPEAKVRFFIRTIIIS
jgi:hypothetical protein